MDFCVKNTVKEVVVKKGGFNSIEKYMMIG
jgi:hypothetical protein